MDFGMEAGIFLVYTAGLMIIYFFGRMLLVPLRKILKLILNSLVGGAVLILINLVGGSAGIVLPVNFLTAVIAGLLGLPGVAGLVIYFNGIV